MNKIRTGWLLLTILLLGQSTLLTAQETNNSGYILFNDGSQEAVIFEEQSYYNNPTKILYRTSADDKIQSSNVSDVQGFWVPGVFKYVKRTVEIDRSGKRGSNLTTTRAPILLPETLLLQVVLEGEANLYMYKDSRLLRFFYQLNDGEIIQLVYKEYLATFTENTKTKQELRINSTYRQQILNALSCKDITANTVKNLSYVRKEIERVFKTYTSCLGGDYTSWVNSKTIDQNVRFTLRAGISSGTFRVNDVRFGLSNGGFRVFITDGGESDVQTKFLPSFEFEYILKRRKFGMISFFLEAHYQSISGEIQSINERDLIFRYDLNLVNTTLGGRLYFPVYKRFSPFVEAGTGFTLSDGEIVIVTSLGRPDRTFLPSANFPYRFGGGFDFNQKFDLLIRTIWYPDRGTNSIYYSFTGISLGYRL